jgi:hypothetical protein
MRIFSPSDVIRAIDNHAYPVRITASGEKPDRDFG